MDTFIRAAGAGTWAVAATVSLMAGALAGQEVTLRGGVSVVVAPVSVTDGHGRFVEGLVPGDFERLADGKPQRLALDEIAGGFSWAVVVETSEIAGAALAKVRKLSGMLEPLIAGADGEVAVLGFAGDGRRGSDL